MPVSRNSRAPQLVQTPCYCVKQQTIQSLWQWWCKDQECILYLTSEFWMNSRMKITPCLLLESGALAIVQWIWRISILQFFFFFPPLDRQYWATSWPQCTIWKGRYIKVHLVMVHSQSWQIWKTLVALTNPSARQQTAIASLTWTWAEWERRLAHNLGVDYVAWSGISYIDGNYDKNRGHQRSS